MIVMEMDKPSKISGGYCFPPNGLLLVGWIFVVNSRMSYRGLTDCIYAMIAILLCLFIMFIILLSPLSEVLTDMDY